MYGATFVTLQHHWQKGNYFYGFAGNMMETHSESEAFYLLKENVLSPMNMGSIDTGRFEYSTWYCGVTRHCYCGNGRVAHIIET